MEAPLASRFIKGVSLLLRDFKRSDLVDCFRLYPRKPVVMNRILSIVRGRSFLYPRLRRRFFRYISTLHTIFYIYGIRGGLKKNQGGAFQPSFFRRTGLNMGVSLAGAQARYTSAILLLPGEINKGLNKSENLNSLITGRVLLKFDSASPGTVCPTEKPEPFISNGFKITAGHAICFGSRLFRGYMQFQDGNKKIKSQMCAQLQFFSLYGNMRISK